MKVISNRITIQCLNVSFYYNFLKIISDIINDWNLLFQNKKKRNNFICFGSRGIIARVVSPVMTIEYELCEELLVRGLT